MQDYTNIQTDLTLDWFIANEESYTTRPRQPPTTPMAKLLVVFQDLVIVTLTPWFLNVRWLFWIWYQVNNMKFFVIDHGISTCFGCPLDVYNVADKWS